MLQGEILVFYLTFVLLRGHLFASIETFGSHFMKCNKLIICGFTKIYLYDVQTTQVQELLIQLKLLPHHYSQGNVEVLGTANAGTQLQRVAMGLSALV